MMTVSLLAFLALCAGHAELWVTMVNRLYGRLLPIDFLHRFRSGHDVAILLFPVLVLWRTGFDGPRQFLSGNWQPLSGFWIGLFSLCTVGLIGFLFGIARWWVTTRNSQYAAQTRHFIALPAPTEPVNLTSAPHERTFDVSEKTRALSRLPGNQQFTLEISHKQITPADWPEELDGLSILHLSDWHLSKIFSSNYFQTAAEEANSLRADLIVYTGDLCDDIACLDWLPESLGTLSAPLGCWFILGNHDALIDHARIRAAMQELGWNDLGSQCQTIHTGSGRFDMAGDETPWLGSVPTWSHDAPRLPRILLAHSPDRLPYHATRDVDLILSGHTHGGQIILPLIGPVYAPSQHGCRYTAGLFTQGKTAMHVSRGLAGMHPLRYGAGPEITRLVVRSPVSLQTARPSVLQKVQDAPPSHS